MSEYSKKIYPMECDYYRNFPPSAILRDALHHILEDIIRDGCDRKVILARCGAVWMISRMRFEQYAQLTAGDVVVFRTFPRVIENDRYIFYVEVYRGEELVIRFDTVFIPVNQKERKLMSTAELEPLWKVPPREAVSKSLVRLNMEADFTPGGSAAVRFSDCDSNRHLTSPCYLSMICDELKFWGEKENLMEFIQVDFASEVLPGTTLRFETAERDGAKLIRGWKEDGKLAFSAMCRF